MLSAELTTESLKSECEVDGVLKQVPKIVPGATIKLNTALNRFKGVGSSIALLKRSDKRLSSLDEWQIQFPSKMMVKTSEYFVH